jgi:hypothetical protein
MIAFPLLLRWSSLPLLFCTLAVAQDWRVVDKPTPMVAMTYDAVRMRVQVLDQRAELYEAAGKHWLLRPTSSGLPTVGEMTICHDPIRHRTVALVVQNRLQPLSTYEWDGAGWTLRTPVHTPTLSAVALTFDAARNVVLALGRNEVRQGMDTFAWDGTDWQLLSQTGPPVPGSLQMTFDRARGVAVAMLSVFSSGSAFQHWEWNGNAWLLRQIPLPGLRDFFAFGYDAFRQRTLLASGISSKGLLLDAWEFDGAVWRPVAASALQQLFIGCTYVDHLQRLHARAANGDLYEWTGGTWIPVIQRERPPISQAAYDARRGSMICFGGTIVLGPSTTFFGDSWEHRGVGWERFAPAHSPAPRTGHSLWSDGVDVWLYGGMFPSTRQSNEAWRFDGRDWNFVPIATPPPGRINAGVAYDAQHSRSVLFGGENNTGLLSDTWLFDGVQWTQAQPGLQPPARSKPAMAYDRARGYVVMCHGLAVGFGQNADAWQWNGQQWSAIAAVAATSPFGRATMAFDETTSRLMLFTAEVGQIGVWSFDGTVWTRGAGPAGYSPFTDLQAATDGNGAVMLDSGITWRRSANLARAESFGGSCAGAAQIAASTVPAFLAPAFAIEASGLGANAPALLLVGTLPANVAIGGCTLLIGNPQCSLLATDGAGNLVQRMSIPMEPALRGVTLLAQVGHLAATASGIALSAGLRLRIGD